MWRPDGPQGNESAKVRFEVLPWCAHGGLDIGCGPSKVWPAMIGLDSGKDTDLFGVAMRPDMVITDAARLPMFADNWMPCVFSSHLLEHIEDWQAALKEWWRVVRIGGTLVLYLPHADLYPNIGQPGANPDHKHDFRNDDIVDFFRLAFPDWTLLENQVRGEDNEYSLLLVLQKEAAGHGQIDATTAPRPEKKAAIVRLGGNGDALWAASVAAHLADDGYHVTVYCAANGADVLRHDPHVQHVVALPTGVLDDHELIRYWAHEGVKYDKWVNLINSVEGRLLPHQSQQDFYLPHAVRHRLMNVNYLDQVHAWAELPDGATPRQKFYPSEAEAKWATDMRARLPGPLVVLSASGSGPFKRWPHAQRFMELMADAGVYTVVLGDLAGLEDLDLLERDGIEYGHVIGREWPLRAALAYALQADAVVATESVFANAVAFEPMPKVVLLSHSSHENLTRDWTNTAALEAPVACHPCHRIHDIRAQLCARDTVTGASACMAHYSAESVADLVLSVIPAQAGIQELKAA
jgi:predicted SAM-dependent methyltransferase/ADP-heptose:LPS heptosyltransferase